MHVSSRLNVLHSLVYLGILILIFDLFYCFWQRQLASDGVLRSACFVLRSESPPAPRLSLGNPKSPRIQRFFHSEINPSACSLFALRFRPCVGGFG